jgi:hypothetical protein
MNRLKEAECIKDYATPNDLICDTMFARYV